MTKICKRVFVVWMYKIQSMLLVPPLLVSSLEEELYYIPTTRTGDWNLRPLAFNAKALPMFSER